MIETLDLNQIIFIFSIMILSAVVVGFLAGFFGIGGGIIMVPILFYIFSFVGMDKSFVMHMAIGTSFLIIIPNSIISTITHMKFKAVDFDIVKSYGIFVVLGVIFGTYSSIYIANTVLVRLRVSQKTVLREDDNNN